MFCQNVLFKATSNKRLNFREVDETISSSNMHVSQEKEPLLINIFNVYNIFLDKHKQR